MAAASAAGALDRMGHRKKNRERENFLSSSYLKYIVVVFSPSREGHGSTNFCVVPSREEEKGLNRW